jgi:phenylpropionate dioxygenase-like ring-hydroxylating dioxygenase large terminal subunit
MTFAPDGRCVRIPGQTQIPNTARVTSFPTGEKMGVVWLWMGDPALADRRAIYSLPQCNERGWTCTRGDALKIGANYLNVADNLCDPAHVSFVHTSTLGNTASENVPVEFKETVDGVLVWRWILNSPPIPLFRKYGTFRGMADRWQYFHFIAPCIAVIDFGSADAGEIDNFSDRSKGLRMFACHFLTPVDSHTCIDHWLFFATL